LKATNINDYSLQELEHRKQWFALGSFDTNSHNSKSTTRCNRRNSKLHWHHMPVLVSVMPQIQQQKRSPTVS